MKKISLLLVLLFLQLSVMAQDAEMAFDLRQSGKIYVVVSVIVVVFAGIALWLFALDNRLKKIERRK